VYRLLNDNAHTRTGGPGRRGSSMETCKTRGREGLQRASPGVQASPLRWDFCCLIFVAAIFFLVVVSFFLSFLWYSVPLSRFTARNFPADVEPPAPADAAPPAPADAAPPAPADAAPPAPADAAPPAPADAAPPAPGGPLAVLAPPTLAVAAPPAPVGAAPIAPAGTAPPAPGRLEAQLQSLLAELDALPRPRTASVSHAAARTCARE